MRQILSIDRLNDRLKFIDRLKKIGSAFITGFSKHDDMTLSAGLAFYTALSLAPLVLLVISAIGLLGGNAQNEFLAQTKAVVGDQASEALAMIVKNANEHPNTGGAAGVIGIVTLIFSASAVFGQLQSSLNVIWEAEEKSNSAGWVTYLRKRFFSMGMVIALAFLAVVSLLVSTFLDSVGSADSAIWGAVHTVISVVILSFIFSLVFKYLPDIKISWRHVLAGGFFTALLFTVGRSLIGLYLSKSAVGSAYGAAGSLIVLLAWVYYSSIIVFMGAELTRAVFSEEKDPDPKAANISLKSAPAH